MKKLIIFCLFAILFNGCNLEAYLDMYSNSELIIISTTYCNSYNGNLTVHNNSIDLLYLDCTNNDIITELYKNGRSYIERHNVSKSHEIKELRSP